MAVERLDAMAAEIAVISGWLDRHGDTSVSADKASCLLECAARDLLAAAWVVKPPDHSLPEGHLADSRAMRR